jgi:hypothetical protein
VRLTHSYSARRIRRNELCTLWDERPGRVATSDTSEAPSE